MVDSRIAGGTRRVVPMIALAALVLAGCGRNTDSAAPSAADKPLASAEYPLLASAVADSSATAAVTVKVSLAPALAGKAAPGDVVFIFARAAHGPRMPLAIVRKQVRDLPATVVLDDSLGMSPQMKLSSVPEVVVVARVSKAGHATAQAGDLEGMSAPVRPGGAAIAVSIANIIPGR